MHSRMWVHNLPTPAQIWTTKTDMKFFERHELFFFLEIDLHVTGMPDIIRVLQRIRKWKYFKHPP